ncbi:MAG: DEAD/DEAH box helicase [Parvularculaceae bacterium]
MKDRAPSLPPIFEDWFAARGWRVRPHQLECFEAARAGRSHLLIAPTGGGKTLAGFLPSLADIHENGSRSALHTLYISPLKALAVDIARNLERPIAEMQLAVKVEARSGDTPVHRRQRQKYAPPDLLLTTPEQVALLLSHTDAPQFFSGLRAIIVDELHSFHATKRGQLLALNLARLRKLAPNVRSVGLSATARNPDLLLGVLKSAGEEAVLIRADGGVSPKVRVLDGETRIPWSGHSARYAWRNVYEAIRGSRMSLIFVNTRSQAEMTFQALWSMNDDNLPIALHHGSLDVEQRRKVEAAMTRGALRAVVCTSTLDLGIDWGDVDLVIQIGAPKGASRLTQRIGRANHRMDEPSAALLVPGHRFEVLECIAAKEAIDEGALDGDEEGAGALDILAQHILCRASSAPFAPDDLFAEVTDAAPYRNLSRADFDQAVEFAATGGYALKSHERFRRIVKTPDGRYRIRNAQVA